MDTELTSPFVVCIAKDRLSATIEARPVAELSSISPEDVVATLEAAGVAIDERVCRKIDEYVRALRDPSEPREGEYEIATGQPATDGADGTFAWEDSLKMQAAEWSDDEVADFYNVSSVVTVEEGRLLGWITPPQLGADGIDVHGNPLVSKHQPTEVMLKEGVQLGEDGKSVFATISGRVIHENSELSICDVLDISGDVDFRTGNLDVVTDLVIRGSIRDLFRVKTQKSLIVREAVEGAYVEAVGNVTVCGGILNRTKGRVSAGGDIAARFCHEADLRAGGEIRIGKGLINSRVHTEDRLIVSRGAVIGGEIYAKNGVEARTLGSEAEVVTKIVVGLPEGALPKVSPTRAECAARLDAATSPPWDAAPNPPESTHLTGGQRERSAVLINAPDTADAADESPAKQARSVQPYVLVSSLIHGRVSITINGRTVTFAGDMKGPIKIQIRKFDNYSAIAAFNQLTGSVRELPSQKLGSPAVVAEAD